jgi:hypothetical protein
MKYSIYVFHGSGNGLYIKDISLVSFHFIGETLVVHAVTGENFDAIPFFQQSVYEGRASNAGGTGYKDGFKFVFFQSSPTYSGCNAKVGLAHNMGRFGAGAGAFIQACLETQVIVKSIESDKKHRI